ncbi:MAG: Fe-S cluster assembly protein SufD [Verrucomicrobia bacterium]|nr:Fe-S cluster assembly protein SufD [Verrucomicrobiota bacterium]MBV8483284.1 Fe-S cluster assembly protein SufD [Verrucomicrobiota bacterium]
MLQGQKSGGTALDELSSASKIEGRDNLPQWFVDSQTEARKEFASEPYPSRKDELWRFSSVKNLDGVAAFSRPATPGAASLTRPAFEPALERGFPEPAGRMVFVNDQLVSCELLDDSLSDRGVLFLPLGQALKLRPDLLQAHFMAQPARLGSKKFAALHKASVSAGTVLYLPPSLVVDAPFEVFHIVTGENLALFPHTLIIADKESEVTFLDHFVSTEGQARGFACGVNDLVLRPGSKLNYIGVQNWSRQFVSVQVNSTVAGEQSSAVNLSLNFGGRYSRLESVSRLAGAGSRSDMLAVSIAGADQEFDQRTLQDHLQPDTTSDLLYKNALSNNARTVFSGLIKVERGAHRTDAYQKVRNLLLSDEAEANSMPGLEILADDVRCTHGATSGQVEPEELFYLQSRGIPELKAKGLVVNGFLNEVVDRLSNEEIKAYLHEQIANRLAVGG